MGFAPTDSNSLELKYIAKKRTELIANERFYHFKNEDHSQNYWASKKRNDWRSKYPKSLFEY
jgi:hypothetical protein